MPFKKPEYGTLHFFLTEYFVTTKHVVIGQLEPAKTACKQWEVPFIILHSSSTATSTM